VAGMYPAKKGDGGDDRIYNNLFAARANVRDLDGTALPCYAGGNVYTKGVQAPKLDTGALIKPDSDSGVTLTEKPDGWYLTISEDPGWRSVAKHPLVTTDLLGKASVTNAPFDNRDGSPIRITTDYFGARRDLNSPFPGPFEAVTQGTRTIKVWPKAKNAN